MDIENKEQKTYYYPQIVLQEHDSDNGFHVLTLRSWVRIFHNGKWYRVLQRNSLCTHDSHELAPWVLTSLFRDHIHSCEIMKICPIDSKLEAAMELDPIQLDEKEFMINHILDESERRVFETASKN